MFTLALLAGAVLVVVIRAAPERSPLAQGGAPAVISYQGEVRVSGAPYSGDGHFKFAVVNAAGNASHWSNDGTSAAGSEPSSAVQLAVDRGLFNVLLGDTALGGMTQPLSATAFALPDRYLRVWFSASAGGPFAQLAPDTRIAAVPYALQAQEAVDADTVDGKHASQLGPSHYQNVVIVAKSGGDYTSVQAAMDSITDAAADNPYLVRVAPGVYNEAVTLKPYVHLQGAGQENTVITSTVSNGNHSPTQATLVLARDASVRDLTVGNGGAGSRNAALLATAGVTRTLVADVTARVQGAVSLNYAIYTGSGVGVRLQQVTALAEDDSGGNYGLYSLSSAMVMLRGGAFTGRGGSFAVGIYSGFATLDAEDVTARGEDGGSGSYGMLNYTSATTLRGGSFTGSGGGDAWGISNGGSGAILQTQNVIALGENGSDDNHGLRNYNGAAATLRGGAFTGRGGDDTWGIYSNDSGVTLEAEGVTALGGDGNGDNYGLYNTSTVTATLRGGSFIGRGGTVTRGIYNTGSSATLQAERITALGESATNNYGLYNSGGATADVTQSVLGGATNPVYRSTGTVTVSNSRLIDKPVAGTVTCVAVSRAGNFLATGCQ
jgi:hypothetical protein